jgi:hypothetical protein
MENAKIFMHGEETPEKNSFIEALSRLLCYVSFSAEYERKENPYLTEDLLPATSYFFIISLKRKDIANLLLMSVHKGIQVIFFFEEKFDDLPIEQRYFLSRVIEAHEAYYVEQVSCEKNEGVRYLQPVIIKEIL